MGDIVHTPTHTLNELYILLAHLVFMIFVLAVVIILDLEKKMKNP